MTKNFQKKLLDSSVRLRRRSPPDRATLLSVPRFVNSKIITKECCFVEHFEQILLVYYYMVIFWYLLIGYFAMDKAIAEHVAEVMKAVAHPVRLQIIELLEKHEMCVGDIVEGVGGKQAITSQHLNMMRDKGVLGSRRDGAKVYYSIENRNVIKLLHCIHDHCETRKR